MDILERTGEETVVNRSSRAYVVDNRISVRVQSIETFSASELVDEIDGIWTVRDLETGIFGTGPNLDAATADFESALAEHLDVLEHQSALSEELEAQREYLRRRLS